MEDLRISNDVDEFDFDAIHHYLCNESYWAKGIERNTVCKAFINSLSFGGFIGTKQVAFGRVVTDLTTFGFLRDIVVLSEFQGNGYGKAIIEAIIFRLKKEGVPAMMLGTLDAHSLYKKYGFNLVGDSPKLMVWRQTNASQK